MTLQLEEARKAPELDKTRGDAFVTILQFKYDRRTTGIRQCTEKLSKL